MVIVFFSNGFNSPQTDENFIIYESNFIISNFFISVLSYSIKDFTLSLYIKSFSSSKTPSNSSIKLLEVTLSKLMLLYLDSFTKYCTLIGDKFSISNSFFCIVLVAKRPKSIRGVFIAISGPIIFAKTSISNDKPSSNWNTILDLNFPKLSGVNLILKTTS